jgi:putative Holliday junction resolvase
VIKNNIKILAIDFGNKNIGLAIGFKESGIVLPKETLSNHKHIVSEIIQLIHKNHIEEVVLGCPLYPSGEASPQEAITMTFYHQLKNAISIPIIIVDERLTTKIAKNTMRSFSFLKNKQKKLKDMFSAQLILETYLKNQE